MAEINYDQMKTEYISSDVSLRSLARKYGVSISALSKRAKKDCWETAKETIKNKSEQIVTEQTIDARTSIANKCIRILEKMVDKVDESVDLVGADDISGKKQLVSMLKDLQDMGAFVLGNESDTNTYTVHFINETEDYGE